MNQYEEYGGNRREKRNGEDNEFIIAPTLVDSCGGYLKEEWSPFSLNEAYLDSILKFSIELLRFNFPWICSRRVSKRHR